MSQIQKNYIAGNWVEGVSSIKNMNPSNHSEVVGEFAQASSAQVQEALAAAQTAQVEWQATGLEARLNVLQAIGDEMIDQKQQKNARRKATPKINEREYHAR